MDVFEALKAGREVDMYSESYRPCIEELHRADRALFHLNHAEPQTEAWRNALQMDLPFIRDIAMQNSGRAYMIAKRVNHLQAMKAAATTWKARRARINTLSPGVIVTPLAYDEFSAAGEGYQRMIDASAVERTGTAEEIAEAGAFLPREHAGFITVTDLLIDGGTIAASRTGQYKLGR